MNKILLIAFSFISTSFISWQPDFATAVQTAKEKHELILLNFSGSDWCGPCIRLRNEIFENKIFLKFLHYYKIKCNNYRLLNNLKGLSACAW